VERRCGCSRLQNGRSTIPELRVPWSALASRGSLRRWVSCRDGAGAAAPSGLARTVVTAPPAIRRSTMSTSLTRTAPLTGAGRPVRSWDSYRPATGSGYGRSICRRHTDWTGDDRAGVRPLVPPAAGVQGRWGDEVAVTILDVQAGCQLLDRVAEEGEPQAAHHLRTARLGQLLSSGERAPSTWLDSRSPPTCRGSRGGCTCSSNSTVEASRARAA
jgi:hypothetical protein